MKLEEFLEDVTHTTNIVIIESHLKKENDEFTKSQFPDICGFIHFFGERMFAIYSDELKEIGDYEICSIEMVHDRDNIPFIAVYIMGHLFIKGLIGEKI